jgi:hypothetical protein
MQFISYWQRGDFGRSGAFSAPNQVLKSREPMASAVGTTFAEGSSGKFGGASK